MLNYIVPCPIILHYINLMILIINYTILLNIIILINEDYVAFNNKLNYCLII